MSGLIKAFLIVILFGVAASQNRIPKNLRQLPTRTNTAFLHRRPAAPFTRHQGRIQRALMTARSKRADPVATSPASSDQEEIAVVQGYVTSIQAMQKLVSMFEKVREKQQEIESKFEIAYGEDGRIMALEVVAPFLLYISVLAFAKLFSAPCTHELGVLWISTVVFTILGINNKNPDERTRTWVGSAILTHFLCCWVPLQVPFVADWLILPETQSKLCHVESFIPSSLETKHMDLSTLWSRCSCDCGTTGQKVATYADTIIGQKITSVADKVFGSS